MKYALGLIISVALQYLFIKLSDKYGFLVDNTHGYKNHKTHKNPAPRTGGIAIFIIFALGVFAFGGSLDLLVMLIIPFTLGIYEDFKKRISANLRFISTTAGALVFISLFQNAQVRDVGFALPLAIVLPFTVVAITGLTHSINIIDGLHGLASGVSLLAFSLMAGIGYQYGDSRVFYCSITMVTALLGFFVWNFPRGKVFLGDSGAYISGFLLAAVSLFMTSQIPAVSPWFPVVLLAYPIFDTLFSIYRRRVIRGVDSFSPDMLHLHTLLYKRYARGHRYSTGHILAFSLLLDALAFALHQNTTILIVLFFAFCLVYLRAYELLVKFKTHKIY